MTPPVRLLIAGSRGRMGKAVSTCAREDLRFRIAAEINSNDSFQAALSHSDVSIDFTQPEATLPFVKASAHAGKPIVIGTTGHSCTIGTALAQYARTIPIVLSPNFSTGVNLLFWLTRKAAEVLGTDFDPEVIEMHHRHKRDIPSGTAARLEKILAEVHSPLSLLKGTEHSSQQGTASALPCPNRKIGVHSLRVGDVVGEHTVIFAGSGECLELAHKASSRDTFALGSLQAAIWVLRQPAGLYSMQDVLGLPER
ncbi:MAG: 4-hydroxy-tetrahydrodipicolinate reductase [Candidatus Xiphinematobacter sp.]|nr:MAG: 4-hydroxy-tetrahydrodipicolinate reductase [Candidatus Xiphinematobacter sp.]QQY09275.1 MAG: 4-hydroxy-tetrahydrodipicolinate reductase [Candidatus Xiphinematobacter sp.]QQY10759.1 MAG: 4-hydroxy-tetrahydrodipicolinate reductase [Candidatus Xiphinematobacter sp.]QQY11505.1 MAG: 4-hydroxy-tetrahydrodipicolinate reductase [Candidatus Xiphinematobacter sp.]